MSTRMRKTQPIAVVAAIVGGSTCVTPYYNSAGPVVLGSSNENQFVATIRQMKKRWNRLGFVELYVEAIRLYDMGYRKESTYLFYTAQYRGRLFALSIGQRKMGSIGSPGRTVPNMAAIASQRSQNGAF